MGSVESELRRVGNYIVIGPGMSEARHCRGRLLNLG